MSDRKKLRPIVIHTNDGNAASAWTIAVIVLIATAIGVYFLVGPFSNRNIGDVDISVEAPANTAPTEPAG